MNEPRMKTLKHVGAEVDVNSKTGAVAAEAERTYEHTLDSLQDAIVRAQSQLQRALDEVQRAKNGEAFAINRSGILQQTAHDVDTQAALLGAAGDQIRLAAWLVR